MLLSCIISLIVFSTKRNETRTLLEFIVYILARREKRILKLLSHLIVTTPSFMAKSQATPSSRQRAHNIVRCHITTSTCPHAGTRSHAWSRLYPIRGQHLTKAMQRENIPHMKGKTAHMLEILIFSSPSNLYLPLQLIPTNLSIKCILHRHLQQSLDLTSFFPLTSIVGLRLIVRSTALSL